MRTTVDLPPGLHEQIRRYAQETGQSVSATVAGLAARGLASQDRDLEVQTNPVSGFPMIDLGRTFTVSQVRDLLDEDE
ncbi:MAG: hypothetical protein LBK54_08660 [Propionibacteriaceae bacterium]|jgi:hypothetical protein|nr:hypothetical protein [Propionibacteriaceae bacterium]